MSKLIVIMPAYNVEKKIEAVFENIEPGIMSIINSFVIVDDGSVDNTREKIIRIKKKDSKIHVEIHSQNRGYGAAQKTALNKALSLGSDICISLHSDGQCDPSKIPELAEPILNESADLVIGTRMLGRNIFNSPMPFHKYCGNRVLTFLANLALKSNISEFHTGYIAYSRKALETIPYEKLDDRFQFDGSMIIMALINNLRITEVSVPVIYKDEKSNAKIFSYALDVLKTIWRYKRGYFHSLNEKKTKTTEN